MKLSVIVPSYKEKHLQRTVDELLSKSELGKDIEVIVVLDGYWPKPFLKNDERVKIIHYSDKRGLRNAVNMGVSVSTGEFIMKTDAHCMFDHGYDKKIIADIADNEVHIPLRYFLDTDAWEIMPDKAPSSIDKLVYLDDHKKLHGEQWKSREKALAEEMLVETMCFQGSAWVMKRKHWDSVIVELQEDGYGTFTQEPLEIALKTWLSGGRCVTNKKTWYAHQHRKFGRTHQVNQDEIDSGNAYAIDFWINNRWDNRTRDIEWLFEHFGYSLNYDSK